MKTNRTFTMLKPDSIEDGYMLPILNKISESGFKIIALKYKKMNREEAQEFYSIHSEKAFFNDLINFITRGPIVAAVLEKDNAVEDFRKLIGLQTLMKLRKEQLEKVLLDQREKMLSMAQIVMRMRMLRFHFTLIKLKFSVKFNFFNIFFT